MNKIIYLIIFCGFLPIYSKSQTLDVKVYDLATNLPIPYATVFINGSKIGGSCDSLGRFKIFYKNKERVVINVSSLGYELKTIEIEETFENTIEVGLENTIVELEGFSVRKPIKRGYQKYGYLFFKELIGYSEFSKKCKILNPEVINFYFDEENEILTAKASEPILIENNALGYLITLYLNGFEVDFYNQISEYSGLFYFKDLLPSIGNEKVILNRENAYNGSIHHFFSSLYNNNLKENGFEIKREQSIPIFEAHQHFDIKIDTLIASKFSTRLLISTLQNKHESFFKRTSKKSLFTFSEGVNKWITKNDENLTFAISSTNSKSKLRIKLVKINDIIECKHLKTTILEEKNIIKGNYLYSEPILPNQIIFENDKNSKLLNFNGDLRVNYLNEPEEKLYSKGKNSIKLTYQTSLLNLIDKVTFLGNGDYEPFENLLISGYWSYEKLDKLLPIEYK
jgi:hypothetical protein